MESENKKERIVIGIDTGVSTGVAIWNKKRQMLTKVETVKIHKAMKIIEAAAQEFGKENIIVRFEDARKRKWYGNAGREKLQGAGSVKRDAVIWQDFLNDIGIEQQAVAPSKGMTKLSNQEFEKITKWKGRTSNHARDAAMLVFGF